MCIRDRLCTPSLTTIHQPKYEAGVAAFKLLRQSISGEEIPGEKRHVLLETRMIERDSAGYAPVHISEKGG